MVFLSLFRLTVRIYTILFLVFLTMLPAHAFDPQRVTERDNYIIGNTLHVALHEAGHMLIDQLKLPVLGQEEDAADNFATIALIDQDTDLGDLALADTAHFWFMLSDNAELEDASFFDEHDLDIQRAYRIVCHLVGVDPIAFDYLAKAANLAAENYDTCGANFELTADSWFSVLEPNKAPDNHRNTFQINFDKPKSELKEAYHILKQGGAMEDLITILDNYVMLPNPIQIHATMCGEENAFYDPETATIVICYELVEFYGRIFDLTN
ncbi:DUF4344 domain-containing metallopeptidase [Lentilitoribacter sp. EG35]|uniref:DUF4344 domain-containing metallopeptidase n=1 Tax=Lentilitoribacter sp. EG35 TaxID=3234192 RepID=UPI00345FA479